MNKLKISCLIILLSSFAIFAEAQHYQLEAGYLNPKRFNTNGADLYLDAVRLGITTRYDLKYNFGIETGVSLLSGYGYKAQYYPHSDSVTYKTWSHMLEIPLRINYQLPVSKTVKLFGFAGPNFQVGLAQNTDVKSYLSEVSAQYTGITSGKVNEYADNLQRINIQLGAGGGVQWKQYLIKGGFDWGLNNLNKKSSGQIYQQDWYVTLGWQFK